MDPPEGNGGAAGSWSEKKRLARAAVVGKRPVMPAAIALGLLIANLGGQWTTNSIPLKSRLLAKLRPRRCGHTTVLYAIAVAVLSVLLFSISPVLEDTG